MVPKALLSNLIQSVLMSIRMEMDTMQTSQLKPLRILLSKKIPKRAKGGLLSAQEPLNGRGKLV